jgi:hypothetical protein
MDLDYIKRLLNEIDAINFPYCSGTKHRLLGCVQTYDVMVAEILRMCEPSIYQLRNWSTASYIASAPEPFLSLFVDNVFTLFYSINPHCSGTTHPLKVGMSKDVHFLSLFLSFSLHRLSALGLWTILCHFVLDSVACRWPRAKKDGRVCQNAAENLAIVRCKVWGISLAWEATDLLKYRGFLYNTLIYWYIK